MKLRRTLRMATHALRRNVLRSALTTLGIIIGVAAVIAMMEIGQGSSTAIRKTIASMGANNLSVQPGTAAAKAGLQGGKSQVTIAGESYILGGDVITAADGVPVDSLNRLRLIDKDRVVLRGFSMGGAGTWHLGLHRPDNWCVLGPGAGFTSTHGYIRDLPPELPPESGFRAK